MCDICVIHLCSGHQLNESHVLCGIQNIQIKGYHDCQAIFRIPPNTYPRQYVFTL